MGRPGVGKTTAILALAKLLGREEIAGFFTKEIRDENGNRIGFMIEDFVGNMAIMAGEGMSSQKRVGSYGVDISAMERIAIPAVESGLNKNRIIIIDEIGKMELFSEKLRKIIHKAMKSAQTVIATIMAKPYPPADEFKRLENTKIIEIKRSNRDSIPQLLLSEIENSV